MGRLKPRSYPPLRIAALLALTTLSGCAAITTISALPGALFGVVSDQFSSEEISVAYSMRATLAATQHSLQTMRLDIDTLEMQADGDYGISFTNHNLDGSITLRPHTARLTTIQVSVTTTSREESIEQAIVKLITNILKQQPSTARLDVASYKHIYAQPDHSAKQLGWFRPGARLEARNSDKPGWLAVTLPSGDKAFLYGDIIIPLQHTENLEKL